MSHSKPLTNTTPDKDKSGYNLNWSDFEDEITMNNFNSTSSKHKKY